MERFFGFDLGDAESAVARLCKTGQDVPEMLKICSSKSFITAYAVHLNGKLLIGEQACYSAQAIKRGLRFKSHFLDDAAVESDVKRRVKTAAFISAARPDGIKMPEKATAVFFRKSAILL